MYHSNRNILLDDMRAFRSVMNIGGTLVLSGFYEEDIPVLLEKAEELGISGIKAHYSAEEMVGKRVMVVTNLKPAKLAGVLSEGMILCAEDADGNLSLMVPEKEMPAGAEIC